MKKENASHMRFLESMQTHLSENISLQTVYTPLKLALIMEKDFSNHVIVAIGTDAALEISKHQFSAPVILNLVPKATVDHILLRLDEQTKTQLSAIYLDQPFRRQVSFIKHALPQYHTVALLFGPTSVSFKENALNLLNERHLDYQHYYVENENDLFHSLNMVTSRQHVFLVLPDPMLFTRRTVPHILLNSYRSRMPVIAHSKAYVQAGALAAIFSTAEQLGEQAAAHLLNVIKNKKDTPQFSYPAQFSVTINQQVSRSLGLFLDRELDLIEKIQKDGQR